MPGMRKYFGGDRIIWMVIIFLAIYSLLAVYSTSGILLIRNPGNSPTYFVFRHGLFLMAGFLMIYITHLVPYKYFSRLSQLLVELRALSGSCNTAPGLSLDRGFPRRGHRRAPGCAGGSVPAVSLPYDNELHQDLSEAP